MGPASLPTAWEICVLQGVGAKVTSSNVADLDLWQVGEGGSTENDNTFNPFNTKRGTDQSGDSLPFTETAAGFPAFASWPAGCAATTATILQPNMAAILSTLVAGGTSPPQYLTTVDQTPWCAPENGQPCYALLIALAATAPPSGAISLLDDASSSVASYVHDVSQILSIENTLSGEQEELVAAQAAQASDQQGVQAAVEALRTLAVYEYTSDPSIDRVASLDQFEALSARQLLTKFYEGVDAVHQVGLVSQAQAVLHEAVLHTRAVGAAISATQATLVSTQADEGHWVSRIASDVQTLHNAGGCPGTPEVPPGPADATSSAVGALSACLQSLEP